MMQVVILVTPSYHCLTYAEMQVVPLLWSPFTSTMIWVTLDPSFPTCLGQAFES